jgi:uncharacterized protein YggE
MNGNKVPFVLVFLPVCIPAGAQQANQLQLKIDSSNRTLSVSADERVTADPDLAILHVGFQTPPSDAKSAYAAGARTSNEIVASLKKAGIPEASIRSERQSLESTVTKTHKFRLVQSWAIKTPPERVAEILDIEIAAGATESGSIDWTLQDVHALEDQALDHAATRARSDAAVLAKAMGAHLGSMVYVTNDVSASESVYGYATRNFANAGGGGGGGGANDAPQALARISHMLIVDLGESERGK